MKILLIFCVLFLLPAIASAENEFEVLALKKMPEIQELFSMIPAQKAALELKIQGLRDERGRLADLERSRSKTISDEVEALKEEIDNLEWQIFIKKVRPLVRKYSWAIPNDQAITGIKKYGPIVEIAAGSGYWAKLLKDAGVDIVAYDNGDASYTQYWTEVKHGDENIVTEHPDRTLFLCWPPKWNEMAFLALKNHKGQHVIYAGEMGENSATATPLFFKELKDHFDLVESIGVLNWPPYSDKVYVFRRR